MALALGGPAFFFWSGGDMEASLLKRTLCKARAKPKFDRTAPGQLPPEEGGVGAPPVYATSAGAGS